MQEGFDLGRLADTSGIRLRGVLNIEVDKELCAEDLIGLLGSKKRDPYEDYEPEEEYSQPPFHTSVQGQPRRAPWLNQKPSNPGIYPISAGLMSYGE